MEKQGMNKEDLRKVVGWFEKEIALLESLPIYPEIREGVERLKEKVNGFKGGLNDRSDSAFRGPMEEEG